MYIIGVTGGIACGKTVVSREISRYGAAIISADQIAYELSEPGAPIYDAYVRHFGADILREDGSLDRRAIACIVFNDDNQKRWVDDTTHPMLLNRCRDRLVANQAAGIPITVLDVPLLFEAGWDVMTDEVWAVWLSPAKQFRRLMFRNRISYLEAFARINAQMSAIEKKSRADVSLNNNKTRYDLRKKVARLMNWKFPHLSRDRDLDEEEEELKISREAEAEARAAEKAALEAEMLQSFEESSTEEAYDFPTSLIDADSSGDAL